MSTAWAARVVRLIVASVAGLAWPAFAAASDESAPVPAFDILEYRIVGNTKLTRVQVEEAVYPAMGPGRSIADVEAARSRLEAAFHAAGFLSVIVEIPEQQVKSGVVTLTVVEAPVGRVRITGSRYVTHDAIQSKLPSLKEGQVPDFKAVQEDLAWVNRSQDRRVTPVLQPSAVPGKVDVELRVADQKPIHGLVELNNRNNANTSPTRFVGQLRYDNLFQRDHSLGVQFQTAPESPSDTSVWSLSYVIPTRTGTTWAAYAVRARSDVAVLSGLSVIGNGNIYGLRRIDPLPGADGFTHSLTFGVDYKDFRENVVLQGADTVVTPVSYAPFSAQYNAAWLAADGPVTRRTSFTADSTLLVRGLVADRRQFLDKRFGASTSFLTLRGTVQHEQERTGLGSLAVRADGALASGPLISNEQFAGGGLDTVRGYTEFECLGDAGTRASIEARRPGSFGSSRVDAARSRVYAFFDAAWLRTLEPLPGQRPKCNLASVGIGMLVRSGGLGLRLDLARVFDDGPITRSGDVRLLFQANYAF